MAAIRNEKWVLITEAHPYHHYIKDDRPRGGSALVEKSYDENCPLCRAERAAQTGGDPMTTAEKVEALSGITNKDEAGVHFTKRYSRAVLDELEAAGLISITKPVHQPSGIMYDEQYWTVEITREGSEFFDAHWPLS